MVSVDALFARARDTPPRMHSSRMHLAGATSRRAHRRRPRRMARRFAHVPRAFCSPDTRVALRLRQTCRAADFGVSHRVDLELTRLRDTRACPTPVRISRRRRVPRSTGWLVRIRSLSEVFVALVNPNCSFPIVTHVRNFWEFFSAFNFSASRE